jgi:hypothetical protein
MVNQQHATAVHRMSHRAQPSHRIPRVAAALGGLVILAMYLFHAWWVSPEHRIVQFLAAGQRGDAAAMLSLAAPEEVQRLGLTPAKYAAMLADAARAPGGIRLGDLKEWVPLGDAQHRYNRWGKTSLYAANRAPLLDSRGKSAELDVIAYNTDGGWKIGASEFLYLVLCRRQGDDQFRKERYAALCQRYGIPAELYWADKGEWESISGP